MSNIARTPYYRQFQRKLQCLWKRFKNLELTTNNTSNYVETLSKTLQFSLKLPVIWSSGNVAQKKKLQKLIFPDGITYDRKNGAFRTPKINEVFDCIAYLNSVSTENKKGQINENIDLSLLAVRKGFEPLVQFNPYVSLANWWFQPLIHLTIFWMGCKYRS